MSNSTINWCSDCDSSFKDSRGLRQHQKKTRSCQKYKNILFVCQICQYQTQGLKNMDEHIKICVDIEPPLPTLLKQVDPTMELTRLNHELEVEKTRVKILWSILGSVTNINLKDLVSEHENELHIFGLSSETTLYLHENTCNEVVSVGIIEDETDVVKIEKSSNNYRRVKKIVVNPEPNKEDVCTVIDTVDKMKKTFTHLEGDTITGIKEGCKEILSQIVSSRTYSKLLTKLKQLRSKLLGTLTIDEYKVVLNCHVTELTHIFTLKQQNERKIKTTISKSLTPIDTRLLQYHGFTNTQLDAECRDTLKNVFKYGIVSPKEFIPYTNATFMSGLSNYGVAVFPIEKLIKWCNINPYNFFNVIYVTLPKSSVEDPYSFYTLGSIKKGHRKWDMNCRLEDFSSDISSVLLPYMVSMFRDLYYHLFNDNVYRPDYLSTSTFAMEDCEQLAQNIVLVSQPKKFCNKLRALFIKGCTYNITSNDSFNLTGDDALQRKRYQEHEKEEMVGTVGQMFDDITDEQSVLFYKRRNIA